VSTVDDAHLTFLRRLHVIVSMARGFARDDHDDEHSESRVARRIAARIPVG
jgi:hypothetical protein